MRTQWLPSETWKVLLIFCPQQIRFVHCCSDTSWDLCSWLTASVPLAACSVPFSCRLICSIFFMACDSVRFTSWYFSCANMTQNVLPLPSRSLPHSHNAERGKKNRKDQINWTTWVSAMIQRVSAFCRMHWSVPWFGSKVRSTKMARDLEHMINKEKSKELGLFLLKKRKRRMMK